VADSGPSGSAVRAFPLFEAGLSVDEVAQQLGRARSTTMGYLLEFIQAQRRTDPAPWVDAVTAARVVAAQQALNGEGRLTPIFKHLGEAVPYEVIRIALACARNAAS
jgi:ATP-dependent DNA helicase RecQ